MNKGLLIVICGPSGVGKTTLCQRLQESNLGHSLTTCTTRKARPGEIDGQHYHFISEEQFQSDKATGKFVESATVHGRHYGIRRCDVENELANNKTLILNIDVQGASTLRQLFSDNCIDIFIDVAHFDVLRERLEKRSSDSPEIIEQRLAEAKAERSRKNEFTQVLINDDLDTCYQELENFIKAYRKEQHV